MNNLTHTEQNSNNTATKCRKNTASTESASKQSVPGSGSGSNIKQIPRREKTARELIDADIKAFVKARHPEQIKEWIFFSRELAEQVGITGAIVTYGLYTWIKSPRSSFGYNPVIDGKRACYRSTRELAEEDYLGLWDDTTMLQTIKRLEEASIGLIVDRTNVQLHFAMSDKLIRMHESKKGFLGFRIADALKYGVLPAILLANLDFQVDTFANCLTDGAGIKYGELSPTKLTKFEKDERGVLRRIIPKSRDAVSDAVNRLKRDTAIVAHPTRTSFYRRVQTGEIVMSLDQTTANQREAKVSSGVAEISTREAKISNLDELFECNGNEDSNLCQISETLDSNIDRNLDRKCLTGESTSLRSVAPPSSENFLPMNEVSALDMILANSSAISSIPTKMSNGALFLKQMIDDALIEFRHQESQGVPKFDIQEYAIYEADHDDELKLVGYDLFYDYISHDINTGLPYTREREVDYLIEEIGLAFSCSEYEHTKTELNQLKRLFLDHPLLTVEHIFDLSFCPYIDGYPKPYKKGHDYDFFGRRVRNLKQLLRYLPQLIKERHVNRQMASCSLHDGFLYEVDECTGRHRFDYSELEEPLAGIAFPKGVPDGYV